MQGAKSNDHKNRGISLILHVEQDAKSEKKKKKKGPYTKISKKKCHTLVSSVGETSVVPISFLSEFRGS